MDLKINKKGLGRGLSSLMGEVSGEQAENFRSAENKIPISKLRPSPIQPRRIFEKASITELADSIKSKGLVQPILVRPSKSNPGDYEIIAGERRWRAAQVAQDVRSHLKEKVFETVIPRNVRMSEAPSFGLPALIYDHRSKGSQAYIQLANEILKKTKNLEASKFLVFFKISFAS